MDYSSYKKSELISEINGKDRLIEHLQKEMNRVESIDFAWTGNLGHWYWDIKTNHVTFNPLKVKALSYSEKDIPENIGFEFFTNILHPDDYEMVMQTMRDHLSGKIPLYETEYRIQTKEGYYKWFYDRGKITRYDKNGKPEFLSGIVFDITQRKEHEIYQKKLISSLSSQMEIKEKISSIIFHDIKSPLSTIYGFANMITSVNLSSLPEEIKDHLATIENLSMKTIENINYISSWLRSGIHAKLKIDECRSKDIVDPILGELEPDLNKKNITVTKNISSETLRSNKEILRIALRNLMINAIKFTPHGGHILITWNQNCLLVKDNGMGMSQKQMNRLFTENHISTFGTDKEIGHGLGLHIVKDLLTKINADIKFDSSPGKGTEVKICV